MLHRHFQTVGNSQLTGRQGYRLVNRNHSQAAHNENPNHREQNVLIHLTQKDQKRLQSNTEAKNYRTENHQAAATLQALPISLNNQHKYTTVYALLEGSGTSRFLQKNIAENFELAGNDNDLEE